jgi:hypothetical protein
VGYAQIVPTVSFIPPEISGLYGETPGQQQEEGGYLSIPDHPDDHQFNDVSPYATQAEVMAQMYGSDLKPPERFDDDLHEPIHDFARIGEDPATGLIAPYASRQEVLHALGRDDQLEPPTSFDDGLNQPIHDYVRTDEDPSTGLINPYASRREVLSQQDDLQPPSEPLDDGLNQPIHDYVHDDVSPYAATHVPASHPGAESHYAQTNQAQSYAGSEPIFDSAVHEELVPLVSPYATGNLRTKATYEDVQLLGPPPSQTSDDPDALYRGFSFSTADAPAHQPVESTTEEDPAPRQRLATNPADYGFHEEPRARLATNPADYGFREEREHSADQEYHL